MWLKLAHRFKSFLVGVGENNLLERRKKAKIAFKTRQKVKDKTGFYNLYAASEFSVLIEIHENQPVSSTVLPIMYEGRGGKRIWSPQTTATQDEAWKIPCSGLLVRGGSALKRTTISMARNTSYTTNQGGSQIPRERKTAADSLQEKQSVKKAVNAET